MIERRKTRQIQLGQVKVGGDAPITVQSMTKTDTRDVRATVQQIWSLEAAGCEIVRCAVPVREAAEQLGEIKKKIRIPLVADIHFNYKLALIAIEQGVDGLRLNPGNIGARKYVEEVVKAASERKIPIRIGVNAGSLEKDLLQKYNGPTAAGMVESGLRHIHILEDVGYSEIKISLKASDPLMMIEAYRMLADRELPLSSRCHRSRDAGHRHDQIRRRPRHAPGRRYRRYHSRVVGGRPGGRSARRFRNSQSAQAT